LVSGRLRLIAGGEALSDCVVVEAFSPVREDYLPG